MALLDILTPENIADRFYTLPEGLQAILQDGATRLTVQAACIAAGVTDPDELQAAESVMAAVVLGFIHMDDLKGELSENLSLRPDVAASIADAVRAKILEPLRKDIEKIYEPITAPVLAAPMPVPAPRPIPAAKIMDIAPLSAAPAPMKPFSVTTRLPVTVTAQAPTATPTASAGPAASAKPAPFMMHQESIATPMAAGSDFKLNMPSDMFKVGPGRKMDVPLPPKAAELEIGKAPLAPKAPGVPLRMEPSSAARVVHYTDLRTSVASGSIAPAQAWSASAKPMPAVPAARPAPAGPSAPAPLPATIPMAPRPVSTTPIAMPLTPTPKPMPITPITASPAAPAPQTARPMPGIPESAAMAPVSPATTISPKFAPLSGIMPPTIPLAVSASAPKTPATPLPNKPPKVVNFGPEEVK